MRRIIEEIKMRVLGIHIIYVAQYRTLNSRLFIGKYTLQNDGSVKVNWMGMNASKLSDQLEWMGVV